MRDNINAKFTFFVFCKSFFINLYSILIHFNYRMAEEKQNISYACIWDLTQFYNNANQICFLDFSVIQTRNASCIHKRECYEVDCTNFLAASRFESLSYSISIAHYFCVRECSSYHLPLLDRLCVWSFKDSGTLDTLTVEFCFVLLTLWIMAIISLTTIVDNLGKCLYLSTSTHLFLSGTFKFNADYFW